MPNTPATTMGTPKSTKWIYISPSFSPKPSGWRKTMSGKAKVLTDYYAVSVAHEILHAVNVFHHGDKDISEAEVVPKVPNNITDPGWTALEVTNDAGTVTAYKIEFFDDAGKKIMPRDARWATKWNNRITVSLGMPNGQHSGVEDCIMRYDCANAYLIKPNKVYYMQHPPGTAAELSGITLCTGEVGTGVNAKTFKPRPRYGDATAGRGKCKQQFCVNDRYH
jgi:hypothetical protein